MHHDKITRNPSQRKNSTTLRASIINAVIHPKIRIASEFLQPLCMTVVKFTISKKREKK